MTYAQTNTFPSSGNVGIGTTNPGALLDIKGVSSGQRGLQIIGSAGNSHIPYVNGHVYLTGDVSEDATGTGNFIFRTYDGSNYFEKFLIKGTTGYVGIGTENPSRRLDIKGDVALDNYAIYSKGGSTISFGDTGVGLTNEDDDIGINLVGNGELEVTHNDVSALTIGNDVLYLGREGNMKIGIGTNNPSNLLTVNGTAKAEEIVVEENIGADFVFSDDYQLPTLFEVEKHIKANKHLSEIPSAQEMIANGVKVGELQMKLLQKIEELTLYVIELKKLDREKAIQIQELKNMLSQKGEQE